VHSVHRALKVGALHHIIPPASLRPYLIQAVERGVGSYADVPLAASSTSMLETALKERAARV